MLRVAIGARLRAICLARPEATGELMRRGPSYPSRIRFSCLSGRGTTGLRSGAKSRRARGRCCGPRSRRAFSFPHFGAKGWIGVGLDAAADWREIEAFARRSYRLVAPKRLATLVA
jgi:hypothetical protein